MHKITFNWKAGKNKLRAFANYLPNAKSESNIQTNWRAKEVQEIEISKQTAENIFSSIVNIYIFVTTCTVGMMKLPLGSVKHIGIFFITPSGLIVDKMKKYENWKRPPENNVFEIVNIHIFLMKGILKKKNALLGLF